MNRISNQPSRREVLVAATAAGATALLPTQLLAQGRSTSPSEKLNIAAIGVGGRGYHNLQEVSGENIVAICDVDDVRAADAYAKFPKAQRFRDFRRMLDQLDQQIDAVVVSTPDHTHAVAVLDAFNRGKHVYCEKPLAHDIREVRAMVEAAEASNLATQLGNQGHSSEDIRRFCEWIWDGAIGPVREVHAFCHSDYSKIDELGVLKTTETVPDSLDWNLWLGPAAKRPYHSVFAPNNWRGWMPFGTGVIGDWVCHVLDPVFWALELGAPATIHAETFDYDPKKDGLTFPPSTKIEYEFAAKGDRPALKVIWFDGKARPERPAELPQGQELPDIGALVIGDQGKIVYGSHGAGGVRIIPDEKMRAYQEPSKTIQRSQGHHADWINACKGGPAASSSFAYGGPLAELGLLGVIAIRSSGRKLTWNAPAMEFVGDDQATAMLQWPYRDGWNL